MASPAQASSQFNVAELDQAARKIDRNSDNKIEIAELRNVSEADAKKLVDSLRAAAEFLIQNPNAEPKVLESLRNTVLRLRDLNALRGKHEMEIRTLHRGVFDDLFRQYARVSAQLSDLKADVQAIPGEIIIQPAPKVEIPESKVAVTSAVIPSAPTAVKEKESVKPTVVPEKPAAAAKETKESKETAKDSFQKKKDFLTADESIFRNADKKRVSVFGQKQMDRLINTIVPSEAALDARIMDLTGSKLDLANETEAKAVREKFFSELSRRLKTLELLYARTVGKEIGKVGGGGLIHVLQGTERELVTEMFQTFEALEAVKDSVAGPAAETPESLLEKLRAVGLGGIVGPIYLAYRGHTLGKKEIETGESSDPLSIKSNESKTNFEIRATPILRIAKFALGVAAEGNFNFNDREQEIVAKVKEAAKTLDDSTDPATGKLDISKVPADAKLNAEEYNKTLATMSTGNPDQDRATAKALRDATLYGLVKSLAEAGSGTEIKNVGIGVILLLGFLPIRIYGKVGFQSISTAIKEAKVNDNGLAALDSLRTPVKLSELGVSMEKKGSGYSYAINPEKRYKIENQTPFALENGRIESDKPLAFERVTIVSDTYGEKDDPEEILVVSLRGAGQAEAVSSTVSPYEAKSDAALATEVRDAMKGVSTVDIRQKYTHFQKLQEAIAKAYASGNPESAFKLLGSVRIDGKHPLRKLMKAHVKDSPERKREIIGLILEETPGDWRVRNFDKIKTDKAAFADFKKRTGYKGTQEALTLANIESAWHLNGSFDSTLLAKTELGKLPKKDREAAIAALDSARKPFSENIGKLSSIEKNSRTISNAIGFVNFHQVAFDDKGKPHARFQDVVPVSGTIRTVDADPKEFENADIRRALVNETPKFVLESLLKTINEECAKVGAPGLKDVGEVRKVLLSNGDPKGFRPDIKLTSHLAYTRFAKCLNDTYLITDMKLCVEGPNGQSSTCAPSIPETATSTLEAPVGMASSSVSDVDLGISNAGSSHDQNGGNGSNGGFQSSTTTGVSPVGGAGPQLPTGSF